MRFTSRQLISNCKLCWVQCCCFFVFSTAFLTFSFWMEFPKQHKNKAGLIYYFPLCLFTCTFAEECYLTSGTCWQKKKSLLPMFKEVPLTAQHHNLGMMQVRNAHRDQFSNLVCDGKSMAQICMASLINKFLPYKKSSSAFSSQSHACVYSLQHHISLSFFPVFPTSVDSTKGPRYITLFACNEKSPPLPPPPT